MVTHWSSEAKQFGWERRIFFLESFLDILYYTIYFFGILFGRYEGSLRVPRMVYIYICIWNPFHPACEAKGKLLGRNFIRNLGFCTGPWGFVQWNQQLKRPKRDGEGGWYGWCSCFRLRSDIPTMSVIFWDIFYFVVAHYKPLLGSRKTVDLPRISRFLDLHVSCSISFVTKIWCCCLGGGILHGSLAGKRWCEIWLDQIGSRWDVLCELSLGNSAPFAAWFLSGVSGVIAWGEFQHRNGWRGARWFPYQGKERFLVTKTPIFGGLKKSPMPKPCIFGHAFIGAHAPCPSNSIEMTPPCTWKGITSPKVSVVPKMEESWTVKASLRGGVFSRIHKPWLHTA